MKDRREAPDDELDEDDGPAPTPGRRFARLVESPVSRRVAIPRLLAAGAVALGLVALAWVGVSRLLQSAGRWVDQQPERQLPFDRIELDPPPGPWVKGGAAAILEQARRRAGLGETVSLLDLDLKEIELAFRHCDWIKDVLRVDRSHYGRLIVRAAYRRPAAVVVLGEPPRYFILDGEAVVLDESGIDWASSNRPLGMTSPLFRLLQLPDELVAPKAWLPIKRRQTRPSSAATKDGSPKSGPTEEGSIEDPDPRIRGGARLAQFLHDRLAESESGRPAIEFNRIHLPEEPGHPHFLEDSRDHLVAWGPAPGDERHGQLLADARWAMLMDWLKEHGPLVAKRPQCLDFGPAGAFVR